MVEVIDSASCKEAPAANRPGKKGAQLFVISVSKEKVFALKKFYFDEAISSSIASRIALASFGPTELVSS